MAISNIKRHGNAANKLHILQQGFTLIEILIASVILFLMISTGFVAYQSAIQQNQRAVKLIYLYSYTEIIRSNIRHELHRQQGQQQGEGSFNAVHYKWRITDKSAYLAAPAVFNELANFQQQPNRFALATIELILEFEQLERQQTYQELVWLPLALPGKS